jgi:hypothetical protein
MLECFLDGHPLFRWAWLNAFRTLPIVCGFNWQTVQFLAMGDPTGFRRETELLLHPHPNFEVGSGGGHKGRLSRWGNCGNVRFKRAFQ